MALDERAEWDGTKAFVGGLYAAKLYIIAPILLAVAVMAIFGEGNYILAILAVLYAALFAFGERKRWAAELRTFQRSFGFHIAVWSFLLAALCGIGAVAFLIDGGWRYFG